MVAWLDSMVSQSVGTKAVPILDIGTGNALLALELAKLGYSDVTGSDYSAHSIALAQQIVNRHNQGHIRLVV